MLRKPRLSNSNNVVILVVKCWEIRDFLLILLFWWLNVAKLGVVY